MTDSKTIYNIPYNVMTHDSGTMLANILSMQSCGAVRLSNKFVRLHLTPTNHGYNTTTHQFWLFMHTVMSVLMCPSAGLCYAAEAVVLGGLWHDDTQSQLPTPI